MKALSKKLDKIDLHDALLRGMQVDYTNHSVVISIDYYERGNDSKRRRPAQIVFEKVESFSQVASMPELKQNAFAGHVIDWRPSKRSGITYIYLAGGCVAIGAKKVSFKQ